MPRSVTAGVTCSTDRSRLLARAAPLHGPIAKPVGARRIAVHLHPQVVFRTGLVAQVQGRQGRARDAERAEVGGERDARQVLAQVRLESLPVVRSVQQAVDVVPDVVLRDPQVRVLCTELLRTPVGDVVDAPVAGDGIQAAVVGLCPGIRAVGIVGLVAPTGKPLGAGHKMQVGDGIRHER